MTNLQERELLRAGFPEPESEQPIARRGLAFPYQTTKGLLRGSFPFRQPPADLQRIKSTNLYTPEPRQIMVLRTQTGLLQFGDEEIW